jgi:hypothetical protein
MKIAIYELLHPPVTSSFLGSNIPLTILFSKHPQSQITIVFNPVSLAMKMQTAQLASRNYTSAYTIGVWPSSIE